MKPLLLFLLALFLLSDCGPGVNLQTSNLPDNDNEEIEKTPRYKTGSGIKRKRKGRRRRRSNNREERDCTIKPTTSVCDRTQKVEDKIVEALQNKACADITLCDLEEITTLDLSGSYDGQNSDCTGYAQPHELLIRKSDFEGLTELTSLDLSGTCLNHLEAPGINGFFAHLSKIRTINFTDTGINKLAKNFFNGVLDTLDNGGLTFTFIIYCSSPESPWKNKLGGVEHFDRNFVGTQAYLDHPVLRSHINTADYCFN